MTSALRLLSFARPLVFVSLVAAPLAASLAGCHSAPTKVAAPPKNLADIKTLGLPIEPGPAADLGYAIGWIGSFGTRESAGTIGHVRVLGDLVVFVEKHGDRVTALDARSGEKRWVRRLGEKLQALNAPVRHGNWIYVNTESRLHRIHAVSGVEAAPVELEAPVASEPAVLENFLVFSGLDGKVIFYNLTTGYPTWKYQLPSSIRTHAVIFGKSAFAVDSEGRYVMLSLDRRQMVWTGHTWGPVLVDPVLFKDTLLVPCMDGTLYAINRSTGQDLWKYPDMQAEIKTPPFVVLTGSLVVLTIPQEGLRVLSGVTGTELVRIPTVARPVVTTTDGKLLLQDSVKNNLVLMEMPSGRELARVPAMPLKEVAPMEDSSLILVGKDGQLMRLNPKK